MPYVGRDLSRGNYLKLDDLVSQFNGSTTTFNLTSGGSAFFPGSAFSILVSLGGIIQEPESAYTINKSQITFASAPLATDEFFIIALGVSLGVGVPGHGTVGGSQLTKPLEYDDYFYLDSTNNRVGIHSSTPTVALDVVGDIKLNGNLVTAGTGGGGFNAGVVTCTGLDVNGNADFSGNVSIAGTLTYLDVTNIDSVGIITAQQGLESVGVITARKGVHLGVGATVGHLSTVGVSSIASLQVRDIDGDKIIRAATNGRLTGDANLTYNGTNMLVNGTMLNAVQLKFGNSGTGYIDHNIVGQDLQFRVGNSSALDKTALHIDSTGKIGILQTSPDYELDVTGSIGLTGQVRGASGSNSAPTYSFDGDSDTGMYRGGGVNILSFATAATERLQITADGDVGINVTPTNTDMAGVKPRLHVLGISTAGQFNTVARFQSGPDNNDSGAAVVINHTNDRGLVIQGGRGGDADGSHHANSGLARFSIINNSGTFHKFMEAWGQNGGNIENISLFTGNQVEALRITSAGKVGIGTNNPDGLLEVYNPSTSGNTVLKIHNDKTGDAAQLRLEGGRTSTNDYGQILFANRGYSNAIIQANGSADDGALLFKTSATGSGQGMSTYLQIASNGNIKLGRNSQNAPGAQFHVEDTNNTDYNKDATNGAVSEYFVNSGTGDCTGILLQNTSTNATNTCQASIHSVAEGTNKDTALTFGTRQNSDATLRERMRIGSTGNIGLGGITAPLWTTGGGMHLNDNYGIGFGNGGSGRPDFQIVTTAGSTLDFRCGFGDDAGDIQMTTGGEIKINGTDNAIRFYRDAGDRHGSIYYDGGNFNIKNPSNDHTRVLNSSGTELISFNHDTTIDIPGGVLNLGTANTSSGHLNAFENMSFNIDSDNDDTNRYFSWHKNGNSASGTELMKLEESGLLHTVQDYPNIRPALDFNFAAEKKLDPRMVFERPSIASYTDEKGIVRLVGDNTPRFDHDAFTGECKGLLIEDTRTSLLTASTHNDSTSHYQQTDQGETITGPDGVVNSAREYTANSNASTGGSTTVWANQNVGVANGISMSCFVKITRGTSMAFRLYDNNNALYSEKINLAGGVISNGGYATVSSTGGATSNGVPGSTSWELYPNGWVRLKWEGTSRGANATSYIQLYIYDHANSNGSNVGYAVWGFQVEAGLFCTSYIPKSTTAAATREEEFVSMGGDEHSDIWNRHEGTYLIDYKPIEKAVGNGVIIGSKRGSQGSGYPWPLYRHDTANSNVFKSYDNDNSIVVIASAWADQREVWALGFNGTNGSIARNGTQTTTNNTNMKGLIDADSLWLGSSSTGSIYSMHVNRFMYYAKRITDSQLITLTTQ